MKKLLFAISLFTALLLIGCESNPVAPDLKQKDFEIMDGVPWKELPREPIPVSR